MVQIFQAVSPGLQRASCYGPAPAVWHHGGGLPVQQLGPAGFPVGASCGTALVSQHPSELIHCSQKQARPSP